MKTEFDVLVIGGGMVGACMARALATTGLHIAVVEVLPMEAVAQPSYDDRVIALAWGSRRILESLGLWQSLSTQVEPIKHIHISDRGHFGFARLDAVEEGVDALGYVAAAKSLGEVLFHGLTEVPGVTVFCPAQLDNFNLGEERVVARVSAEGDSVELSARLLIAADGGNSAVRGQLGIALQRREYDQTAIVTNVTPEQQHNNWAFERFTDSGPLALLPMTEQRCSVVWTVPTERAGEVLALGDNEFIQALQDLFGWRLGRLTRPGQRSAYPLSLIRAQESIRHRLALIGNAAHTVHPVSGQGFNLGIRDVAVLAEVLATVRPEAKDPGGIDVLRGYADKRRQDVDRVVMITDGLVRLFTNPLGPLRLARNLGLLALDLLPGAKHPLVRQFIGLGGRSSKLSRGLPLG